MPHLMRQQNQHEGERKRNPQQQMTAAARPTTAGKMPSSIPKGGQPMQKVPLQVRADYQRGEKRQQQKQKMQPVSLPRPCEINRVRRIGGIDLGGDVNFWGVVI